MSGECNMCGEHCLDCRCLGGGKDPPAHLPECRVINVNGREEHEAIIKDALRCQELGLDQMYEIMVYLKRWGSWLGQD